MCRETNRHPIPSDLSLCLFEWSIKHLHDSSRKEAERTRFLNFNACRRAFDASPISRTKKECILRKREHFASTSYFVVLSRVVDQSNGQTEKKRGGREPKNTICYPCGWEVSESRDAQDRKR